jgi:hypothetical protein
LSENQYFNNSLELPKEIEFILVRCNLSNSKQVYANGHAVIRRNPETQRILDKAKSQNHPEKPLNVLIFGIDSMSRLNFIRSMPKTYKHVEKTGWFSLQGYNKVSYELNMRFL